MFDYQRKHDILVGGLEHVLFFHILKIIIPTDYFSEGLKPPTSIPSPSFATKNYYELSQSRETYQPTRDGRIKCEIGKNTKEHIETSTIMTFIIPFL